MAHAHCADEEGERQVTPPTRAELITYLVRTGIAGHVDTPRQNNLRHYRRLVQKDPYHQFGLTFSHDWTYSEVLALMSKRCGWWPTRSTCGGSTPSTPT